MQIINVFIAIVVALGYWKKSSKEQEKKTAHASFIKTIILLLLTIGTSFFYYKTYQVATFKNYISVDGIKGSFDTIPSKEPYDDEDEMYYTKRIPYDKVSSITVYSSFSKNEYNFWDPLRKIFRTSSRSGIIVDLELDNTRDSTYFYYIPDDLKQEDLNEIRCCYDVCLMTNSIPSLLPFSVYQEINSNNVSLTENERQHLYTSYAKAIFPRKGSFDKDLDMLYFIRLVSITKDQYCRRSTSSRYFNTLDFFSAADLSQCQYMFIVSSDLPIDNFDVCFDIPVEISMAEFNQNRFDSRSFSIDLEENDNHRVEKFALIHIQFPTLANLQLIRSLILTTILTALYSLLLTNIYYFCRKHYKKYLRHHQVSYQGKKKYLLLWIPTGKMMVWSIIILSAYLLTLSITGNPYRMEVFKMDQLEYFFSIFFIMYCILLFVFFNQLYKRGVNIWGVIWNIKHSPRFIKNIVKKIIGKKKSINATEV